MSIYKNFIGEVKAEVERQDFYGRSFTYGLALYRLMKDCRCSDELREWLYDYIDITYGEVIKVMKQYHLSNGDLSDWCELIPLASLDDLASDWEDQACEEEAC